MSGRSRTTSYNVLIIKAFSVVLKGGKGGLFSGGACQRGFFGISVCQRFTDICTVSAIRRRRLSSLHKFARLRLIQTKKPVFWPPGARARGPGVPGEKGQVRESVSRTVNDSGSRAFRDRPACLRRNRRRREREPRKGLRAKKSARPSASWRTTGRVSGGWRFFQTWRPMSSAVLRALSPFMAPILSTPVTKSLPLSDQPV